MRKMLVGVINLLLLSCPVFSQQPSAAEPPTKQQVLEFLEIMQSRQMMMQMVDGIKAAQKKGAEEAFKHLVPDAKREQLDRVSSLTDETFRDFPIDEMVDALIPIYQRHLTEADLDTVIAFYKSPTGQKFLKERPAMMAEGMQVGQDIMLKKLPDILDRLNTKVATLADEVKGSNEIAK